MGDVFSINGERQDNFVYNADVDTSFEESKKAKKSFLLDEVESLIPFLEKVTKKYSELADNYFLKLEAQEKKYDKIICKDEAELDKIILDWKKSVRKMGGVPQNLWVVEFAIREASKHDMNDESQIYSWSYHVEKNKRLDA